MYTRDHQLGGIKSTLKKIGKGFVTVLSVPQQSLPRGLQTPRAPDVSQYPDSGNEYVLEEAVVTGKRDYTLYWIMGTLVVGAVLLNKHSR